MAVDSMHLGVWSWSRQSLELQTECQNGKESNFEKHTKIGQLKTGKMLPGLMSLVFC